MKALVVDDHGVVREGLHRILEELDEELVFGEASSAQRALELAVQERWDLIILDISLENDNGLQLLPELKQRCPDTPILILSMHTAAPYALHAFKAGAAGYASKDTSRAELALAISRVLAGGRYATPSIADKILGRLHKDASLLPHESLSAREFQVFGLIAAGHSTAAIAEQLSISEKTVATYRARILAKLDLASTAELIHYALRNQLV